LSKVCGISVYWLMARNSLVAFRAGGQVLTNQFGRPACDARSTNLELGKGLSICLESDNSQGKRKKKKKTCGKTANRGSFRILTRKQQSGTRCTAIPKIFSDMCAAVSGFPQQRIQKHI